MSNKLPDGFRLVVSLLRRDIDGKVHLVGSILTKHSRQKDVIGDKCDKPDYELRTKDAKWFLYAKNMTDEEIETLRKEINQLLTPRGSVDIF